MFILNDVGPELCSKGLSRIKSYLGKTESAHSWDEAVNITKRLNKIAFPHYTEQEWLTFTKNLYSENDLGVPVLRYDPAIAEPVDSSNDTESIGCLPTCGEFVSN